MGFVATALFFMLVWLISQQALQRIEAQVREDAGSSLATVHQATRQALDLWVIDQSKQAHAYALSERLLQWVYPLLERSELPADQLREHDAQDAIRALFSSADGDLLGPHYAVTSMAGTTLAASRK
uniref:Uncharacterized protein n=1 Tax=Magnetococcus massalia (strain MO-1) TaxID=451514 RepID=A0A1S7LM60_MAGMO|nr:protein of unknown function [Candidatus Magnetococcus massalia]